MSLGFQSGCDDLVGQSLTSATGLLFEPPEGPGPPAREAVSLRFGLRLLTLRALTDTSGLSVELDGLLIPADPEFANCYRIEEVTERPPLNAYLGQPVYNCWFLTNELGFSDGFMISFAPQYAVLFMAMNNEVSILHVSGEQCS